MSDENNKTINTGNKDARTLKAFFASSVGRITLTLIFAVVIYGVIFAVTAADSEYIALIICALCGYFGWKSLSRIQPSMFLWMSIAGWIVYFFIKGVLSIIIGVFIAPFAIGKKISDRISNSLS